MSTQRRQITYGSSVIVFDIERRDRKTLEITVEPDLRVKIVAPRNAKAEDIDSRVYKRAGWIKRQQAYFRQYLPRTPDRKYIAGETHRYLGRQYRLKVRLGLLDHVKLYRGIIDVESSRPKASSHIRNLVQDWYRARARIKFHERLEFSRARFARPDDFVPSAIIVRRSRQRWGSMSPSHRLVLNTRLIEAPVDAIDYVITHELCHIRHPHHGADFIDLLSTVLPDWERRKERLERSMA
ncbi:M48 family metallopeptidase [Hoeflea sp.]|uniref:M48 family metallopeptidase n=1 Tax=Hoeflea sp. TaxID=1940281 RepID=UPI003B025958